VEVGQVGQPNPLAVAGLYQVQDKVTQGKHIVLLQALEDPG
jgi:hypothetical protein